MVKSNLDWALEYAALDWPIFPLNYVLKNGQCSCGKADCKRIGKHPIGRLAKTGVLEATLDKSKIESWWKENAYYNIGFATGASGRVVIDVDMGGENKSTGQPKNGKGQLLELERTNGMIPNTLMCETGGKGIHYHFITDVEVKNSIGVIAPDIDVRGRGGYVILPPSNHHSGGHYGWLNWGNKTAPLPEWLLKRIQRSNTEPIDQLQKEVIEESKKKDQKLSPELIQRLLDYISADCDRDTWWHIGAALKTELGDKRGFETWRNWSKMVTGKKGWDETVGAAQWISFESGKFTAGTIFKIAQDLGFRGFDREAAASPEIKDKWVYVVGIKRFVELERMIELDREQYDAQFAPQFVRGAPSTNVLKTDEFRKLDSATYWPKKELIVVENGETKLNYWKPHTLQPKTGSIKPFLDHVNYLFPEKHESGILLDYLAYQVQYPGQKVHWAILLQGTPGNGKSYLGNVMKFILGANNVKSINNEVLHEPFTGWIKNKQLIIVEELMAGKRLELMNKLKPMITEPWLSIREMYKPPYEQPNRVNFLFLTNHKDPIIIDKTDRRYCVLASEASPHPGGVPYYDELFEWSRENAAYILDFMLNRDLSAFRPMGHAPMTAGKESLIEETMLPLDHFIQQQVAAMDYPFMYDLVNPAALVSDLSSKFNLRYNPKEIGRAMSRLGYLFLGKKRIGDTNGERSQITLWAVRNFDIYVQMEDQTIRNLWSKMLAGAPMSTPERNGNGLNGANGNGDGKGSNEMGVLEAIKMGNLNKPM